MITHNQQRHPSRVVEQAAPSAGVSAPLTAAQLDPLSSLALQQALPGLLAAFDEPLMRVALQSALFEPNQSGITITQCELDQATYLPDPSCIIRYLLTIQDNQGGAQRQVLVSGRLFADQPACETYIHDYLQPLVAQLAGRAELAMFTQPVGRIAALHMALHTFPLDADLPALMGATDRRGVTALLGAALQDELGPNFAVTDCRVDLVDYGRQQRATLRYHVTGQASNAAAAQQVLVYGKLTGDGSGALAGAISAALREQVRERSSAYRFNVPRVLAWRPELSLSLLEAIPGEGLIAAAIKALLRGKPFAGAALSLEQMIDAGATIAATLHTSGIQLGRPRSLNDQLDSLRRELVQIEPISPALGAQLVGWLDQSAAAATRSDRLPACFNHGDFTYGQLLFDGENSGLIDFDSICQAEPALDLAQFLTYLRVASLKSKLTPAATRALIDHLVRRVSLYKALSLVRRTLRSWQKFKPSRIESALALLTEAVAELS